MRLKLTIAYDGAPYKGWQTQPNTTTVQETLEQALSTIAKGPIKIHGSGRTDTGVHAHAQVAHFDPPAGSRMSPQNWLAATNTKLPASIRLMDVCAVPPDFHARFSATSKTYSYRIETAPVLHPHDVHRVWHLPRGLDPSLLATALQSYIGAHDFRHFSALRGNESAETSYIRTLTEASVTTHGTQLTLRYSANGFLYKMVRLLTGIAVSVAQGKLPLDRFHAMLAPRDAPPLDHNAAKLCAPPSGLSLTKVYYDS